MEWIREKYDRVLLVAAALILLGVSVSLSLSARGFGAAFQGIFAPVTGSKEIDKLDDEPILAALTQLAEPASWATKGGLFTSRPHVEREGKLIDVEEGNIMLHPPVPNQWIRDNKLDLLDPGVLSQDPDGDGFTNLEEFHSQTNPADKENHPPLVAKLRLAKFTSRPFRLLFASNLGDSFQINTIDVPQPSQFVKIGDQIKGTPFKVVKFEAKNRANPRSGSTDDVSELTLENIEKGEKIVLVLNVIGNSPDSFATFRNLIDGAEFRVKKEEEFALKQQPDTKFKLIDVDANRAVIQQAGGEQTIEIPKIEGES